MTMQKFRNALCEFWKIKVEYAINKGELDNAINRFLNGDTLDLSLHISLLPNDVIFMNLLLDNKITNKTLKKMRKCWNKGE